ncbi:phospho-N-acetylmuramoyl-pentapeptide-transferase, partial [Bacteroidales bacterium OttesenSCG-928-C19]|nr:phospho-N-acetylmuramoyl-pentapeptide-transferase [Bacteroidales bacterium OttesenSCG-928-C19]
MLYYLFDWLDKVFDIPGAGVFQYITFRAAAAVIVSLLITIVFGRKFIDFLRKKQVGETVRDLGLDGQIEKQGTPTMGGLLILGAILIPTLLFAKLNNIYVLLMILTTVWLGALGFLDDYIKVFKKNKEGLAGKFKIIGQVALGLIVGLTIMYHPDITMKEKSSVDQYVMEHNISIDSNYEKAKTEFSKDPVKSTKTTIPFVKNNEFDYAKLITWMGDWTHKWVWLLFVLIVTFIITAVSNAANLTDGMDGLATGSSAIVGGALAVLAWVSGNIIFANYLNIMYLPNIGELTVFIAAFVGATIGFLWYNTYPAQVFMGDTGSLAIGGIIAVFAILIRKELLIPILCGVFVIENISVLIQVGHFKRTKRKTGVGKRVFLMAPLHHHYQKKGIPEPKIVQRFFIVGIILAVVSI